MRLILNIANRYLFGKKSTNVINIITGVSIIGISIGTAALILILSVFNGFESLLSGMFNAFNPEIKVVPANGKTFSPDSTQIRKIMASDYVSACSQTLEEVALFEYKGVQQIGRIKGVDKHFRNVINVDSFLLKGKYKLDDPEASFGLIGIGMRNKLSVNVNDRLNPITIYMLLRKKKILGAKEFTFYDLYPTGVFSVRSETDLETILAPLRYTRKLLGYKTEISALEIKLEDESLETECRAEILSILGDDIVIKNKFEQDEGFLKIMNIEKWVSYLIVSFTLLLVAFNLIGCLWMIVLDKRKDIAVLKSLGLDNAKIHHIFLSVGMLICGIGLIAGFILAIILYFIQLNYGIVGIPDGFLIDAYPIKLKAFDFVVVSLTVFFLGLIASIIPARKAANIPTIFNQV